MVKARMVYIWEGPETITITRGYPMERYETSEGTCYKGRIKHKGLIGSYLPVCNIPSIYFGEFKQLFVKNKIIPSWNVCRIKMDYMSHEPYISDFPSSLRAEIQNLRNELDIWKRRCKNAEEKLFTRETKDRLREKIKEDLKFMGEAKNLVQPYGDMGMMGYGYGYPYSGRWGLGTSPTTTHKEETE